MSNSAKRAIASDPGETNQVRRRASTVVALVIGLGLGAIATYVAGSRAGSSANDKTAITPDREQQPRSSAHQNDRMQDFVTRMVLSNEPSTDSERSVQPSAEESGVVAAATASSDGVNETAPADEAREKEIQQLRNALPDNMHLPGKRSKAELQQQLADIQEQQQLYSAIASGKASEAEHLRYYELQAKRFQDEIELAEHCEKTVAGMGETARNSQHPFCSEVASRGKETRESNVAALAALRQELHIDGNRR